MAEIAPAFWDLATKTDARAPQVIDGWLPPKTPAGEDFPFLIVRPRDGTDASESADQDSQATVEIIIGTFSDTVDGWLDVLLVVDAIRLYLAAAPALGGAFEPDGPLKWSLPEEHARPQWLGIVTTIFRLPRPLRVEARNPPDPRSEA
mgnify:CR=1 FL=1